MSTDIVAEVREAVAAIPSGCVASYGDIAQWIGTSPRQVGRAMGLLDEGVPWWRVVHADGTPATCHQGQAPGCWPKRGHRCGAHEWTCDAHGIADRRLSRHRRDHRPVRGARTVLLNGVATVTNLPLRGLSGHTELGPATASLRPDPPIGSGHR